VGPDAADASAGPAGLAPPARLNRVG